MSPEWKIILDYFSFNLGLLAIATIIGLACFIALYSRVHATQTFTTFTLFLYSITAGFTAIITLLFVLALSGVLTKNVIFTALALGVLLALIYAKKNYSLLRGCLASQYPDKTGNDLYTLSLAGILFIAALSILTNVHVTGLYDGTSYHLPYAQFYLEHQGLATNINLRYPYQSHNGNLLYSFALTFADSIYCQTLHSLFGVLTALVIFALALAAGIQAPLATLAAASFLSLPLFLNASTSADVDLFSCFFVTMSIYTIVAWQKDKSNLMAFMMSAASMAMAIGTKYISLFHLLPLSIFVLWNNRPSPRTSLLFASIVLLLGSWWYIRSFLLVGNPIHPFALDLFGYTLWNKEDALVQIHDLSATAIEKNWLHFVALPYFFNTEAFDFTGLQYWLCGFYVAPLFWQQLSAVSKSLLLFTWPFLVFWFLSSQVWRYIMPLAPLFIVICFDILQILLRGFYRLGGNPGTEASSPEVLRPAFITLVVLVVLQKSVASIVLLKNASQWPITTQTQDVFLKKYSPEYQLISAANLYFDKSERIFLFDFFQLNYFLKPQAIGEHFGPNRVRDMISLVIATSNQPDDSNNTALTSLTDQFTERHIDGFIIDNHINYNQQLFDRHFERLYSNPAGAIYRIRRP